MVFAGPQQYLKFKDKNEKLKILGINCDTRSPLVPHIKTAKEQGFSFPRAFGFMLARKEMPDKWRKDVGLLLAQANDQLPKNSVSVYSTDLNWFAVRVAEQKEFLKQNVSKTTASK
jgi:tripartite-type tricarboxylate transporter receptor subunit TctC